MKTVKINIKELDGDTYYFAHIYQKRFFAGSLIAFSMESLTEQLERIYGIRVICEDQFNESLSNLLTQNNISYARQ